MLEKAVVFPETGVMVGCHPPCGAGIKTQASGKSSS